MYLFCKDKGKYCINSNTRIIALWTGNILEIDKIEIVKIILKINFGKCGECNDC